MTSTTPLVRLQDVAVLNPPLDAVPAGDEVVAFLPMSAVDAVSVDAVNSETRPLNEVSKGYTPFALDDVLVAKITPCFENGKIAQAKPTRRFGFGSTEFHVIRPNSEALDSRYLVYFLRQDVVRLDGAQKMTGSAGQRRVPQHFLSNLRIPLPPLPEQRRIAAILDKADALRAKRRAALGQLDALGQAIFLEMFGDPVTNPMGWPRGTIGDLLEAASYGTSQKAGTTGALPILRMNNITPTGEIDLSSLKYVDIEERHTDRFMLRRGDVVFNRTNSPELVGKTAVFRCDTPMAYAGYLIRLRVNSDNDAEYLGAFMNTSYAKRVLRGMCKSIIGMANINAREVQSIGIPMPDVAQQRRFAMRMESVEKLKEVQRALQEMTDTLFTSLQHRAFNGQL